MSIVLAMVVLFAVVWAAFTALRALGPFNYAHFIASILIGVTASVTFLSACLYSKWSRVIMSEDRGVFTKIAAWSSVALAVDSLLIALPFGLLLPWVRRLPPMAVPTHRRRPTGSSCSNFEAKLALDSFFGNSNSLRRILDSRYPLCRMIPYALAMSSATQIKSCKAAVA
jgi:hypothetical protein